MPSLNRIVLIGRLTNDPEMRYTPSGLAVASFTVAVDRPYKGQDGEKKTDFFRCKAWRQKAEFVNQYVQKGRMVALEGRVELNDYVGQDGQKRYMTEISVDQVEPLDSARDRGGDAAPAGGYNDGPQGGGQPRGGGGYGGGQQRGGYNEPAGGNGYYEDEQPAPARQAPRQEMRQEARPPQQQQARPAAAARPAPQPSYPSEDDFDDSDPFADE